MLSLVYSNQDPIELDKHISLFGAFDPEMTQECHHQLSYLISMVSHLDHKNPGLTLSMPIMVRSFRQCPKDWLIDLERFFGKIV